MINMMNEERPDICVISEANLVKDNDSQDTEFREHVIESKFFGDNKLATDW